MLCSPIITQWQAAYDELAEYVWNQEHTTKSYYFGIPFDYCDNVSATTLMFAFEIYENRDVSHVVILSFSFHFYPRAPIDFITSLSLIEKGTRFMTDTQP